MKRLKPLLLLASVLTLHLAAGCANPCLNLADQICSCQPDDVTRSACQQRAREQEAIFPVNSQDQQRCQQALDTHVCDCQRILTPEGRVACRLAYAPDAGTPDAGAFAPLDAPLP